VYIAMIQTCRTQLTIQPKTKPQPMPSAVLNARRIQPQTQQVAVSPEATGPATAARKMEGGAVSVVVPGSRRVPAGCGGEGSQWRGLRRGEQFEFEFEFSTTLEFSIFFLEFLCIRCLCPLQLFPAVLTLFPELSSRQAARRSWRPVHFDTKGQTNPEWAQRSTWDTTRKPTMRNAPLLRGR